MGLFDGRPVGQQRHSSRSDINRYRYLLRTAPANTLEQVHREAFTRLTSAERAHLFVSLRRLAPATERPVSPEPAALARAATLAEKRAPGTMERVLAGSGAGASLFGRVTAIVLGTTLVETFFFSDPGFLGFGSEGGVSGGGAGDFGIDGFGF